MTIQPAPGKIPTVANAPVPQYTLKIQTKSILIGFDSTGHETSEGLAPVNITSRPLTSDGWSEAILLIDEPHSTFNPWVPLLACGDVSAPATAGVCGMRTGTGLNTYAGSAGRPNVFQGKQVAADTIHRCANSHCCAADWPDEDYPDHKHPSEREPGAFVEYSDTGARSVLP